MVPVSNGDIDRSLFALALAVSLISLIGRMARNLKRRCFNY